MVEYLTGINKLYYRSDHPLNISHFLSLFGDALGDVSDDVLFAISSTLLELAALSASFDFLN